MDLQDYIIEYVGKHFDNEEVTTEMVVEILTDEFPEVMLAVAQENFLRGYATALDDTEEINRDMLAKAQVEQE